MTGRSPLTAARNGCIAVFMVISLLLCGSFAAAGGGLAGSSFPTQGKDFALSSDNCCPDKQEAVFRLTKPYMKSEGIKDYQHALKILGCYRGEVTGVFDELTQAAVKEFQLRRHLKPDGVLGIKTLQEIAGAFDAYTANTPVKQSPKGIVEIVVDVDRRTLDILDDGKVFKTYRVAVGKGETPTPVGEFRIKRKAMNWGTGFGTRWLGLDVPWGIFGIHGTNKPWSIGSRASHGCIRMFNRSVEEIYPWVKVGTKVTIKGRVYSPLYEEREKVFRGCKGTAVMLVQQGLVSEGYLKGKPDGIFGPATEQALKQLQKDKGFEVTGQVDMDIWPVIGL